MSQIYLTPSKGLHLHRMSCEGHVVWPASARLFVCSWGHCLVQVSSLEHLRMYVRPGAGRGSSLALCLLAVHSVLALQLKGGRLLTPGDWVVCEVLKGLGSCTAIGKGVLLKAIVVHMRVCAGVFLDGVHPLVVQFGSRRHWRHHGGRLQGLQTTWSLGCRKWLDDANRGRIHAAQHLNVLERQGPKGGGEMNQRSLLHCYLPPQ